MSFSKVQAYIRQTLNIIYIYVFARFVVIIIYVVFVGRWQSISYANFLSNPIAILFAIKYY